MIRHTLLTLALLTAAPACDFSANDIDPAGSGNGSTTTSSGQSSWTCPAQNVTSVVGVRVDDGEACVATDQPELIEACALDEGVLDAHQCFERIHDQQVFWLSSPRKLTLDPTAWAACGQPAHIPPPCYLAACGGGLPELGAYRPSTCSAVKAVDEHACGGDSPWDENCCPYKPCPEGTECGDDEECTSVPRVFKRCWISAESDSELDGNCACVGEVGAVPFPVCLPEDRK